MKPLKYELHKALKKQKITVDRFGQQLQPGDYILVKGYHSMDRDTIAEVKRINRVNLVVDIQKGHYTYTPEFKYESYTEEASRHPSDVIKINAQKEEMENTQKALYDNHPELFI